MNKKLGLLMKRLRKKVKRTFQPFRHHVGVIVSHPKSGRTWLRVMLDELNLPVECTHDGVAAACPFDRLTLCQKKMYQEKPVIFISRDPRDTAVSYYFHRTVRTNRYAGEMGEFIRDPCFGIERIIRYNLTWLRLGDDLPAFLPITYEALSSSPVGVMSVVVKFLNAEVPNTELERVCVDNTFEKMRAREASGEYTAQYRKMLRPASHHPDSYKVRRGKIGGYFDYLTAEDIAYCDDILGRYRYFERVEQFSLKGFPQGAGNSIPSPHDIIGNPLLASREKGV